MTDKTTRPTVDYYASWKSALGDNKLLKAALRQILQLADEDISGRRVQEIEEVATAALKQTGATSPPAADQTTRSTR